MPDGPRPVRIAHAYGNTRDDLQIALAADVDMIEVDVWHRGDDVFIHHARRMTPLPVLVDRKMPWHPLPRFSVPVWPGYYAWPHIHPLKLDELLRIVAGKKRLLLDVKGRHDHDQGEDFATTLARDVRKHSASSWAIVCGQTYAPLNNLRRLAPEIEVRYSLEVEVQWDAFLRKMGKYDTVRQICISQHFIDDEKARILEENGVDVYVWTVDDPQRAAHWVSEGVDGIISNNLDLLQSLPRNESRSS